METLRTEASSLVDIHSQHQQLLLSERAFQQNVLDSYAGISGAVAAHARNFQAMTEAEKALADLDAQIAAAARERDYLEFQFKQLDEASLREGELEDLEEEQRRLAHGESVKEQLSRVEQLFEGEDGSLETRLKEMASSLEKVIPYYPQFESLRSRIDSARIELKDVREEVSAQDSRISFSPQRLEEVDGRLATLYALLRKFGVGTVAELIAQRDDISARLGEGMDRELAREGLLRQVDSLRASCLASAEAIHAAREKAAPGLSSVLEEDVRGLEMPRARFEVGVTRRTEVTADGCDDISFQFDANGRGLKPLSKCASGGELSRIMLCIKSLLARYQGMPTLIFDEIDSGVSGSVAEKMGRLIARMGERMQVVAITHLPQVASKGAAHFLVFKEAGPSGMRTCIRPIEGESRLREIARMLSGEGITPEALANAGVLLQANKSKNN